MTMRGRDGMDFEGDTRGRVAGCLLGLAVGDALGAPFVGRRRGEIPSPAPAASTTAVTARAMHVARSLIDRGGFDADDVVTRLLGWAGSDRPLIDGLTARVLRRVAADAPSPPGLGEVATLAAAAEWERRGPEVSAGNAPVASSAPLGCAYANRPEEIREAAATLTALTHHDVRCATAVTAVASAVGALVRGESPDRAVSGAVALVVDDPGGEELEFLSDAVGRSRSVDGPDRGFVLYAAAVGLQAVARAATFSDGVLRVVGMGGDTATNAAVAGALLGAKVGVAGLPHGWLDALDGRPDLERAAERLAALASIG